MTSEKEVEDDAEEEEEEDAEEEADATTKKVVGSLFRASSLVELSLFGKLYKYGDDIVDSIDLDSLQPEAWVTDGVIDFQQAVLRDENEDFGYLGAKQVQLLTELTANSMSDNAKTINELQKKDAVFIPLNNARGDATGSHWALAVYDTESSTFFYLDSCLKDDQEDSPMLQIAKEKCAKLFDFFKEHVYTTATGEFGFPLLSLSKG